MIMIIEDNRDIRLLLADFFKFLNKETLIYSSDEKAINDFDLIRQENIRVIISDYSLPGMNGIDFIEHAKPVLNPSLCILISGNPPDKIPDNIVMVAKPFQPEFLMQTMDMHLGSPSGNFGYA